MEEAVRPRVPRGSVGWLLRQPGWVSAWSELTRIVCVLIMIAVIILDDFPSRELAVVAAHPLAPLGRI
jgi:hypothetical protein